MTKATDLIAIGEAQTLDGLFRERVRQTPDAPAYREFNPETNAWEGITWAMTADRVARWQTALAAEDLAPGDRVAVILPGGFTWVYFEQAALGLGLVVVPIFARDRPGNAAYILDHSGARLVLIGAQEDWQLIAAEDRDLAAVSRVVTLAPAVGGGDACLAGLEDWLPATGGALSGTDDEAALATLVYTSGTSGPPKGVMLSHKSILSNVTAGIKSIPVFSDDVFLSFLPLNHMLERTVGYYVPMMAGAEVAFVLEISKIADDLQAIQPTCIVSVPRIYDRVYETILETLAAKPAPLRALARLAAHVGWRAFEHAQGRAIWAPDLLLAPILDRLVAAKVRAAFGGRLRVAITGGAALVGDVARFLMGQGVPILQGYGLTELSPVASVNTAANNDPSSVGPALAGVEIRIAPEGEIMVRGDLVMMGYWRNDEASHESVDAEGWLHTGDTGRIFEDRLYIQGRIKDIIVLDTGEKIAPTDMEEAIAAGVAVDQVLVAGEGHPYLIAIVVLADKAVMDEAALLARIEKRCRNFPGYARIRRVIVADAPWTLENDLMTATLKLKRQKILDLYADRIDALYGNDADTKT
jgi:long-chain acyl-CoA synthetase